MYLNMFPSSYTYVKPVNNYGVKHRNSMIKNTFDEDI